MCLMSRPCFKTCLTGKLILLVSLLVAGSMPMLAAEVEIDGESSIFAVVTRKEGLAARLAHDHFIAADAGEATLSFVSGEPLASSFELVVESQTLELDSPELQSRWYPSLESLGLVESPFSELSDKERGKIRKAMLGSGQLAADKHPQIFARLTQLVEEPSEVGGEAFTHRGSLVLEVRGKTAERQVAARYFLEEDQLTIDAVGTFAFSELGIEPYSALFGAIKVADELHVFTHIEGRLTPSPDEDEATVP